MLKFLATFLLVFVIFISSAKESYAIELQDCNQRSDKKSCLEEVQKYYEDQINNLQAQAGTLKNQIAQFNAKISLTETKIESTQEQIDLLGGRIDQLTVSLSSLTKAFQSRAQETYKISRLSKSVAFLISSPDIKNVVSRYYYLQKIQEEDHNLLSRLSSAQTTYKDQKGDLENLNQVLGAQKEQLDGQKAAKNQLLAVTKNSEKQYQQLLAQTKAEYEAIQAIIAGSGTESEVGHINEGQKIASIIQGASCNSGGTHVHFIVRKSDKTTDNPFNYLSGIDYENCSGPGECSFGDPFNPSGNWNWPIYPKIKFTQGYGSTWAVQNTWVGKIYNFHNGIDINSQSSSDVKAVKSGTLYRGSYGVGCRLRYVRVDHDDSDLDTLYLHINY